MFEFIIGGSGSGKSEYAEGRSLKIHQESRTSNLVYIATLVPFGTEIETKINRHREMRRGKGFQTIEWYRNLAEITIPKDSTVLLDCITNIIANEMFQEQKVLPDVVPIVMKGIQHLKEISRNLVIVSNDIFLEGTHYEKESRQYMNQLGQVHRNIMGLADQMTEVVCGLPIQYKMEGSQRSEIKI